MNTLKKKSRWRLRQTNIEINLKYIKKPEAKALYKLQESLRIRFFGLLDEINALEKIQNLLPDLNTIILQKFDDQYRLYAVFFIEEDNELKEKKIAIGTLGKRTKNQKEYKMLEDRFLEIRSIFTALSNISKAILALQD